MICAGPVSRVWPGWASLPISPTRSEPSDGDDSGVAAVYQGHEFLAERQVALDEWGRHVAELPKNQFQMKAHGMMIRGIAEVESGLHGATAHGKCRFSTQAAVT